MINKTIVNISIGKRLKSSREESQMTQSEVADIMSNKYQCSIDERTVRRYETGENSVSIEFLLHFAEIYNKTLDYLVYGHNTTNDDSMRWEDMFKRLNRLIYSGVLIPQKIDIKMSPLFGKYELIALDEETNVFLDNLDVLCKNKNYFNKKGQPNFDNLLKDFDDTIKSVVDKDETVKLDLDRIIGFLLKNKEDPISFIKPRFELALANKKKMEEKRDALGKPKAP